MIDEAWLKQVKIDLGEGYRLDGVHVGGTGLVFKIIYPDGRAIALKLFERALLGFSSYIHEIPNWLVPRPHYDVDRLNRKLANLLGDPQIFTLIQGYDVLFHSILESFYQGGQTNLNSITAESEGAKNIWHFIIRTPAISYRLENYATSTTDQQRQNWAEQALFELRNLGPGDPDLSPESLFNNPLVIWGGAVSEGFFTKAELPKAVSAVERHLLSLPEEQNQIFLAQMYALMFMLHSIEGLAAGLGSGLESCMTEVKIPDSLFLSPRQSSCSTKFKRIDDVYADIAYVVHIARRQNQTVYIGSCADERIGGGQRTLCV